METIYRLTRSSSSPEQLSLTIRGFLVALIPTFIVVTGLSEAELNLAIENIVKVIYLASSLIAAVQITFGVLRKIYLGRWTAAE